MAGKPILVVGGGISGITAAVEAAETGREVVLVEKRPFLGGNVARMFNYFPKLCPPSCGLEINFRRIRQNRRIQILTETTVMELSGTAGNFRANLRLNPKYINDRCTACGKCAEVCPVSRPDDLNPGLETKAAYLPADMAFPMKYTIDGAFCKKEACRKCLEVCDYQSIDLSAQPEDRTLEVSSVVIATGWKSYDVSGIEGLNFSQSPDIVTNLLFERLLARSVSGKVMRPSDGKPVKRVVFVQCAGSRDENHLPYCSAVCCSASLKHAITLRELSPESHATICYIDLRVSGRNEDFLRKAEINPGIDLVKGKVAVIEKDNDTLIAIAEDVLSGKKKRYPADLIVLASGIVPEESLLPVVRDENGFALQEQAPGIFSVSCARAPMDVSSSVKDATGVVLKTIQISG